MRGFTGRCDCPARQIISALAQSPRGRALAWEREHSRSRAGSGVKTVALVVSLLVSAAVLAICVARPTGAWVSWFCLLPLFWAIRVCRPVCAMSCGALWGTCVFAFSAATHGSLLATSYSALLLLPTVPAVFAYLGARLTRWIGFSPLILGAGWMGVELALAPLGSRSGLLGAAATGGTLTHWLGEALGYVLVAFLVAYVNGLLVSALGAVRLGTPREHYVTASGDRGRRLAPPALSFFPLVPIRPSQPRAPPVQVALVS